MASKEVSLRDEIAALAVHVLEEPEIEEHVVEQVPETEEKPEVDPSLLASWMEDDAEAEPEGSKQIGFFSMEDDTPDGKKCAEGPMNFSMDDDDDDVVMMGTETGQIEETRAPSKDSNGTTKSQKEEESKPKCERQPSMEDWEGALNIIQTAGSVRDRASALRANFLLQSMEQKVVEKEPEKPPEQTSSWIDATLSGLRNLSPARLRPDSKQAPKRR